MASGYEGPHSPAKLRKIESNQRNPLFLAWLADMDRELKTIFTQDIPDMPADPYTYEGLNHVERVAVAEFWDEDSDRSWRQFSGRIHRYLGQMFVRHLDGVWKYIDVTGDGLIPVVEIPFRMSYYDPARGLTLATSERTGDRLSYVYGRADTNHAAWVESGRMPLRQWLDFQDAQRLAED